MGLINLAGRIASAQISERRAKAQDAALAAERIDGGLPLGMRIGSPIEIDNTPFLTLVGSLMPDAERGRRLHQRTIVAISRIKLEAETVVIHRFFLDTADDGDGRTYLQVASCGSEVVEVIYYTSVFRLYPTTKDDQAPFLGKGEGLGAATFQFWPDQLAEIQLDSTGTRDGNAARGDVASIDYTRDVAGGDYVAPFQGSETRLDDPCGQAGLTQQVWFSPYVRTLAGGELERLLISFNAVGTRNGVAAQDVHVDYMIGLTLDKGRIKVY